MFEMIFGSLFLFVLLAMAHGMLISMMVNGFPFKIISNVMEREVFHPLDIDFGLFGGTQKGIRPPTPVDLLPGGGGWGERIGALPRSFLGEPVLDHAGWRTLLLQVGTSSLAASS